MIQLLSDWWPWLILALLTSSLSTAVAYKKLDRDCQHLPFFEPLKVGGVWLWLLLQVALPAVGFFVTFLSTKPEINSDLIAKAITFAFGFTALVNAQIDVGFFSLPFDKLYEFFSQIAYRQIAAHHTQRTAAFWYDLRQDLAQRPQDIPAGLSYLQDYFNSDIALLPQEKQDYLSQITKAAALPDPERPEACIALLKLVRRRDLKKVLQRFACSKELIQKLFAA